jgi:CMP-N-acetylneuraminic acid synthetase
MIPVLPGSTRIRDKNLFLVDGYPMIFFYVVRACQDSGMFNEIYIYSENTIFGRIPEMLGVMVNSRNPKSGGSVCTKSNKLLRMQGDSLPDS